MVGGEDGETRGHTAHWERRRVGVEKEGGGGVRLGFKKSGEGSEEKKGREKEGGGRGSEGERKKRARQKARWRLREKVRARKIKRERKERRGNRKGENELQGFYRKLQRDISSLVPITLWY